MQSEIGLAYRSIEKKLTTGRAVLFSGTPCQCAGLRAFLGKEYPQLYLCDFICRGVNSPKVYLSYLKELEEQYNSPVRQVWFKNKTYGWNQFCTKIIFEDGQEYLADRETDSFMLGYIKSRLSLYMRPSCYDCQFKGISRPTDITLGDFWGIEHQAPQINCTNGISLVLIHSKRGTVLWDSVKNIYRQEMQLQQALQDNACCVQSVKIGGQRKEFYAELDRCGLKKSVENLLNWRKNDEC